MSAKGSRALDSTLAAATFEPAGRGVEMRGNPAIIEVLNEILTAELTAINQYFIHAKMRDNWGYVRIAKKAREESIDEMRDAEKLIERILYLDGVPNLQRLNQVRVGENPREQMQLELRTEMEAVERLNRAIPLCVQNGDHGTREMLEEILGGEESAVDWLETQLHLIEQLGEAAYLAEQIHD
jgi:bacterioferritin